ncbi:MAG TPA: hypothetical protein VLF40_03105 [Candidatus Saccharimonadales bacterium]|nr:hypothetical protein [Candidatus Saccharimonadales bacterium]
MAVNVSRAAQLEVQHHTDQITQELNEQQPERAVGQLVLHEKARTFSFQSQTADGAPETCQGSFELQDKVAHVVGGVACTLTPEPAPHQ